MMEEAWCELHFAAQNGDQQRVRQLLDQGWDINAFDELGKTPLHYAASNEHLEMVSLLIMHGANVNANDGSRIGDTPLASIAGSCGLEIARLLIEAGADPTIPGWMQLSAIHRAGERKKPEDRQVYELLLNASMRPRRL